MAVCSLRFDDNSSRLPELKFRKVKGQVLSVVAPVLAANLKLKLKLLTADDGRGTAHRCIDIMNRVRDEGWLGVSTKSLTRKCKDGRQAIYDDRNDVEIFHDEKIQK